MQFIENELMQNLLADSLSAFDRIDLYRARCKLDEAERMQHYLLIESNNYLQIFSNDNCFEALEEMEEIEKWELLSSMN